ncbi:MAG TPA: prepilin-type N-terminal cleavage/methylation domain-containing protein [Gaiellaceae bacterium]|nr:prepilin-type N-terminal cleavage/methylation domain-containing protein [Gaiellaceae bacterium]
MFRGRIHAIVSQLQRRLEGEEGFTLIELSIVLIVMGILLSIAVPSYLSFKDQASKTAAEANVSKALRSVQSYGNDNFPKSPADPDASTSTTDNGYLNISLSALATNYDASISTIPGSPFVIDPANWNGNATSAVDFCLTATVGRWTAAVSRTGKISVGTLFTPGSCSAA